MTRRERILVLALVVVVLVAAWRVARADFPGWFTSLDVSFLQLSGGQNPLIVNLAHVETVTRTGNQAILRYTSGEVDTLTAAQSTRLRDLWIAAMTSYQD